MQIMEPKYELEVKRRIEIANIYKSIIKNSDPEKIDEMICDMGNKLTLNNLRHIFRIVILIKVAIILALVVFFMNLCGINIIK